jgi:flagellar hook protein FlgE
MSLSAALGAAVTALNSQSSALSIISTNLANSSTNGYKSIDASFASLLSGGTSKASNGTGGVSVASRQNVLSQGLLSHSSSSTNMAITGNGFFIVSGGQESKELGYTRNGEFGVDEEGFLVNNGQYLMGWATDASGVVTGSESADALSSIDTDAIATIALPTSNMTLMANLPAEAADGSTFTSALEIYDSLGTAGSIDVTWTKVGPREWTAQFADPTMAGGGAATGTVASPAITINFNADGTLASTNPNPPELLVTGWATGAADSTISLNLGSPGTSSGLSQYSSGATPPAVEVKSSHDGVGLGALSGIEVTDAGIVKALYDNGLSRAIYKVPLATFSNANGLTVSDGGVYYATTTSGNAALRTAGEGGAGTISGSRLEVSTTDTNSEFSKMMAAQQAYSGAAQVMSAANSMFDTLISAVR